MDRNGIEWLIAIRQLHDSAAARAAVDRFQQEWLAGCETWLARRRIEWIAFLDPSAAKSFVEWLRTGAADRPGGPWHYTGTEAVPKGEFVERLSKHAKMWARARVLGMGSPQDLEAFRREITAQPDSDGRRPELEAIVVLAEALRSPVSAAAMLAGCSPALQAPSAGWVLDEVAWRLWLFDADLTLSWLGRMAEQGFGVSGVTALTILDNALRDPASIALGRVDQLTEHIRRGGQGWVRLEVEMLLDSLPLRSPAEREIIVETVTRLLDNLDMRGVPLGWCSVLRDRISAMMPPIVASAKARVMGRLDRMLAEASAHGRGPGVS